MSEWRYIDGPYRESRYLPEGTNSLGYGELKGVGGRIRQERAGPNTHKIERFRK